MILHSKLTAFKGHFVVFFQFHINIYFYTVPVVCTVLYIMSHNYAFTLKINCLITTGDKEGEVLKFSEADPYLEEDKAFLSAVRSGDPASVLCSYPDAAATYCLTWAISHQS